MSPAPIRNYRMLLQHADGSRTQPNGMTTDPPPKLKRFKQWCPAGGGKGAVAGTYRLTYRFRRIVDEDYALYVYVSRRKLRTRAEGSKRDKIEQWRNKVAEEDARAGIHPEDARSPQASRVLYYKRVLGAAHARAVRAGVAEPRGRGTKRVQEAGNPLETRLSLALADDVDQELGESDHD